MTKIIYYYQTFTGLTDILKRDSINVTHIHLSSIHFGSNDDGSPYIHLNDNNPNDPIFNPMWNDIKEAKKRGIKIILMIGGAGGAFHDLFSNFGIYYKLLKDTISKNPEISGIDLDIEEAVDLKDVKMLINKINNDYGSDFTISMAPLSYSLKADEPGMGGFSYKELYNSPEGKRINYFNGQFYGDFGEKAYDDVINNGYPPNKIVMGMLSGLFNSKNFNEALKDVSNLSKKYNNFGGVCVWEYNDCPPDKNDKGKWAQDMNDILKVNSSYFDYCIIS